MPTCDTATGPSSGHLAARLIDALLEEALAVAEDARDWLERRQAEPARSTRSLLEVLIEARETSRLTSRAAHCVAWLLARKALACGEIDLAQASAPAHRLGDRAVCLAPPDGAASLPPRLAELLQRSERLYARIDRLDRMLESS